MGYKKGNSIGTDDALLFGKYHIARCHGDTSISILGKGCVVFYHVSKKKGKGTWYDLGIGAFTNNVLRKINLDLETQSIILESKKNNEEDFKEVRMNNITNKEFFNYVHNHVEKLFGELYEVTPNEDRTSFRLVKRDISL